MDTDARLDRVEERVDEVIVMLIRIDQRLEDMLRLLDHQFVDADLRRSVG